MPKVLVQHSVDVPDPYRLSRYRKNPELGPRVLFFSGGTALAGLSRTLKNYTFNSTHLVTPFDSGGSSAELRRAFQMPAIGDLRARLMSLADESVLGHPEIIRLFSYRLPSRLGQTELREQLMELAEGKSPLMAEISNPMRKVICNHLGYFRSAMPEDFDLRGASIGNLILTGGYLNHHEDMDPILFLFSKLVGVQGTVRAVVNHPLHLGVTLEDGREIINQHAFTGKKTAPIDSPISELFLSRSQTQRDDFTPKLGKRNRKLIAAADLICYPPGSFYSSLLANLLPEGVGKAIAGNDNPKIFVPNPADDAEQFGMTFPDLIDRLIRTLRNDCGPDVPINRLLNYVLVDRKNGKYPSDLSRKALQTLGIEVIDMPLISNRSAPRFDDELVVSALLSLA